MFVLDDMNLRQGCKNIKSLLPRKFFMLFCRLLIFFKLNFFEKFFQAYHQSVKQFESKSGPGFCQA